MDIKKIKATNDNIIVDKIVMSRSDWWILVEEMPQNWKITFMKWIVLDTWPKTSWTIKVGDTVFFPPFSFLVISDDKKENHVLSIREINIQAKI